MGDLSKLILALSEFNPLDSQNKVGGFRTLIPVDTEVDTVFQPGFIPPSDFPTTTIDQYRKIFVVNETGSVLDGVKIYGHNLKATNIMKFALEKGLDQLAKLDGSEAIANYLTAPTLFGEYDFTELFSPDARLVGNSGVMLNKESQGIWLRQRIQIGDTPDPSDCFLIGIIGSDTM